MTTFKSGCVGLDSLFHGGIKLDAERATIVICTGDCPTESAALGLQLSWATIANYSESVAYFTHDAMLGRVQRLITQYRPALPHVTVDFDSAELRSVERATGTTEESSGPATNGVAPKKGRSGQTESTSCRPDLMTPPCPALGAQLATST